MVFKHYYIKMYHKTSMGLKADKTNKEERKEYLGIQLHTYSKYLYYPRNKSIPTTVIIPMSAYKGWNINIFLLMYVKSILCN